MREHSYEGMKSSFSLALRVFIYIPLHIIKLTRDIYCQLLLQCNVNPEPNADLNLAPAGSFHGTNDLVENF